MRSLSSDNEMKAYNIGLVCRTPCLNSRIQVKFGTDVMLLEFIHNHHCQNLKFYIFPFNTTSKVEERNFEVGATAVKQYSSLKLCMVTKVWGICNLCAGFYFCKMQDNKMAAAWNLFLAFGLVTVGKEQLKLGICNLAWRYVINMHTSFALNIV